MLTLFAFIGAGISPEVYGGAGMAALLAIAAFLMRVATYQSRSLKQLIEAQTARIDQLENDNHASVYANNGATGVSPNCCGSTKKIHPSLSRLLSTEMIPPLAENGPLWSP